MGDKLLLYNVDSAYINYLKKYDTRVLDNDYEMHKRPYVGVIIDINDYKYYIPLSSPKEKHKRMKNSLDFHKITKGEELIAVMNINNMVPVHDSDICIVDIENEDFDYKLLLESEIRFIRKNQEKIISKADKLYKMLTQHKAQNIKLARRSCKFQLLEVKLNDFQAKKVVTKDIG